MGTSTTARMSEPDTVTQARQGHRGEAAQRAVLRSLNPYHGETTKTDAELTNDEGDAAIAMAPDRFATWRLLTFAQRATLLCCAAKSCSERLEDLVRFMAIEMAGSDPVVVLEDAERGSTVDWVVWGRVNSRGQSCIGSKRLIVYEAIIERIIDQFREQLAFLKLADSLDELSEISPICSAKAVQDLDDHINCSVNADARMALSGKRPIPEGVFIEPTLLSYIEKGIPA